MRLFKPVFTIPLQNVISSADRSCRASLRPLDDPSDESKNAVIYLCFTTISLYLTDLIAEGNCPPLCVTRAVVFLPFIIYLFSSFFWKIKNIYNGRFPKKKTRFERVLHTFATLQPIPHHPPRARTGVSPGVDLLVGLTGRSRDVRSSGPTVKLSRTVQYSITVPLCCDWLGPASRDTLLNCRLIFIHLAYTKVSWWRFDLEKCRLNDRAEWDKDFNTVKQSQPYLNWFSYFGSANVRKKW